MRLRWRLELPAAAAEFGGQLMPRHLTKPIVTSPSQSFPSGAPKPIPDVTFADRYVVLCDWRGVVVWKSGTGDRLQVGEEVWKGSVGPSRERLKSAIASVATLREQHVIEVGNERGEYFRVWMWPLSEPDIAICILVMLVPSELSLLTERERSCLQCLAQGMTTRQIVKKLGIGLTTVHTHLRRCREKLGLCSAEALIGFAARYFGTSTPPAVKDVQPKRKRSG
jgi:DNA-binding CsgD family transcriptional regulator